MSLPQRQATWRRSSFCDTSACVEIVALDEGMALRDSADPQRTLQFSRDDWMTFIAGVRAGDFDL